MHNKIGMIFILLGIIIVGFGKIIFNLYKRTQDYKFVSEYASKLVKLLNQDMNNEDYNYILSNAPKLSDTMGSFGVMDYQPPFAGYIHRNYNIINFILNYDGSMMNEEMRLAVKAIQMYLGASDNYAEKLIKQLKNPFILFGEGFRFIFNIPLFILYSLGIISNKIYYKVKGNVIYYFIQSIFGLIGFVSSLIGIVQGKEVLLQFYSRGIQLLTSIF